MGVDAVEPDVVVSKDGVLVVRHENEIGSTTDVSRHPEFADRHTTKIVDGEELTGWFTEDFTWAELATLRCRERLPRLRAASASFDDEQSVLSLRDVLDLVRGASIAPARQIGVVLEIKHATYFRALGWDVAGLVDAALRAAGWGDGAQPLVIESFEPTVLGEVSDRGILASYVYLIDVEGRPVDLAARDGEMAPTYRETVSPRGLDLVAGRFTGISVDKAMILEPDGGRSIVADAHERGLEVFTWTCRPENAFLSARYRGGGDDAAFGDYAGEWAVIRDAGIDGVFVDHADLGVDFFRDGPK